MNSLFQSTRELASSVPFRVGAMVLVLMTWFIVDNVRSGSSLPPAVALSPDPLYSKGLRSKPTLTLALSVEFPTVGAQYLGAVNATEDATYLPTTQYLGYFDSESCYTYNNNMTSSLRRFDRTGLATSHACGGTGFSGNFMNWATSSAIDVLRLGLTGGDRVVDTNSLTVLQRAILPNTNVASSFWNGVNFPSKHLYATYAAGAVPTALLGSYTGDVYVANCFNRVHFGTAATGSCASPGANSNLGVNTSTVNVGPVTSYSDVLANAPPAVNPFSPTACAVENGTCGFSGIKQVAYGAGTSWRFASANNGVLCANSVFGDPAPGIVKACYLRSDPTGWSPTTSANVLSSDSFFYTRVSVCDVDGSGNLTDPRTSYCQKYPGGNYKPVGNLQRYSDNVRVSAFGYLNDSTGDPNQRYGGVLRAQMKYVGAKYYDQNFLQLSGTNPQQEWDSQTGVFLQNPDATTTGFVSANSGGDSNWPNLPMSGVTNYLNEFGRTGPTLGQYKTYDPVGELYYEALRYIQGLPPTAAATSGMTTAMQDGYPVYTTWTDPHPAVSGLSTYKCVKNNLLVIGDVHTWNDKSFPGNTRTSNGDTARPVNNAGNEPDYHYWTQVVGSFEGNTGLAYVDGQGMSRTASNFNTPNSNLAGIADQDTGAEGAAYYIAGAAYWANTHDIRGINWTNSPALRRPGMRATTYMLDVNENSTDSDYSTRTATQFFLAAKYGGFTDTSLTGSPFLIPGNAGGTYVNSNSNWSKPSLTGGASTQLDAQSYYLSSSASAVLNALNSIFASIAKGANSIAGAAVSTTSLTATSTGYVYQARFDPNNYWSGDLFPLSIATASSTVTTGAESNSPWHAAAVLDARNLVASPRNIAIGSQGTNPTQAAMPFLWSSLDATTKSLVELTGDTDAVGALRVNFLRGDRTLEGTTFRLRGSRLGDIVNSGIALSGAPSTSINDASYSTFATTYAGRSTTLFVGANDGMLHAFDAGSGSEIFGYIPSWLAGKIGQLSSTAYVHQSYVDATPAVGEALVGGTWKTVLVGGTGGGGQGVYALDVTAPSSFDNTKVLWEFTDKHDASLGNVIGQPQILKFRVNSVPGTTAYRYYAAVASGVNNYVSDGSASSTGYPAIFILDLAKTAGTPWVLNSNYWKIELPRTSSSTGPAQGMVSFTASTGTFGEVSAIYAGDLLGNMWKLDFSAVGSSGWNAANLSYYKNSASAPVPMFTATDASGNPQPITMAPYLVAGRYASTIVAFGTGKYLETSDISGSYTPQSIYALYDNNKASWPLDNTVDAIAGRGRLVQDTAFGNAVTGPVFIWGRPTADTDLTTRAGWYVDLPASSSGERDVSNFAYESGNVFVNTIVPAPSTCDDGGGNKYQLNIFTGAGSYINSTVGLIGPPLLVTVPTNDATYIGGADSSRGRNRYRTTGGIDVGSSGTAGGTTTVVRIQGGRLSWRELNNTHDVSSP